MKNKQWEVHSIDGSSLRIIEANKIRIENGIYIFMDEEYGTLAAFPFEHFFVLKV